MLPDSAMLSKHLQTTSSTTIRALDRDAESKTTRVGATQTKKGRSGAKPTITTTFTINRAHHKKITQDGEQIVTEIYFDVSGEDTTGNTHTFNDQIVSFSPFATDTSANTFIHIDSVTDTILENSIHLYRKYGFQEVALEKNSIYSRGNIKMELIF